MEVKRTFTRSIAVVETRLDQDRDELTITFRFTNGDVHEERYGVLNGILVPIYTAEHDRE